MLHFIPAWYQQDLWCENEQSWTKRRMHTEFDDTVKQVQLFHRNRFYPYQILLLSFAPNFRHFLHRQGVYRAPYWSCFDAIQDVSRKKVTVLSFHNLNWPESVEFIYNMFAVTVMLEGERYAQIDFGEDGNPIRIDLYRNGQVCRRNIYDDRGFVSSTVLYECGKPVYQDYLMENGVWKMRCFQEDGHVEINPAHSDFLLQYRDKTQRKNFSRVCYDNLDQVICEVLTAYLGLIGEKDLFCVAMHERHRQVLQKALADKKIILSFFADRYLLDGDSDGLQLVKDADYIITDSRDNLRKVQRAVGTLDKRIAVIAPYDSRIEFGSSQQLKVQNLLVPVDDMDDKLLEELVRLLAGYLPENEDARICLFTRRADFGRDKLLLETTRQILEKAGFEPGWAAEEENSDGAENDLDLTETVPIRFFVKQCVDELSVSKCMREQRLIVDMRENQELYLQIAAVSFGIPQIVRIPTEYVEHKKNGIIVNKMEDLQSALRYYLDGLQNWNEARVHAYEVVTEHTADKLLLAWKRVIGFVE